MIENKYVFLLKMISQDKLTFDNINCKINDINYTFNRNIDELELILSSKINNKKQLERKK